MNTMDEQCVFIAILVGSRNQAGSKIIQGKNGARMVVFALGLVCLYEEVRVGGIVEGLKVLRLGEILSQSISDKKDFAFKTKILKHYIR